MSALGPDAKISLWPVAREGAVTWEWMVRLGHDSATGEQPALLTAVSAAGEALKEMVAAKAQPTVPGVNTCAVEGCGEAPDPMGRWGQCVNHEEEAERS